MPLLLPLMEIIGRSPSVYRVYKSDQEFVEVNAETAHEAMHKSGLKKVYRILHQGSILENILERSILKRNPVEELSGDIPPQT